METSRNFSQDFSQDIYQQFLNTDLVNLPLRSNNFVCLTTYLQLFNYPGRSKLTTPEALEICQAIQQAIKDGWTLELLADRADINWFWIPPGGDRSRAIPVTGLVHHYQALQEPESVDLRSLVLSKRQAILEIVNRHGVVGIRVLGLTPGTDENTLQKIIFSVKTGDQLSSWFPVKLIRELTDLLKADVGIVTADGLPKAVLERLHKTAQAAQTALNGDRDRLLDIQEAIGKIEAYSVRGRSTFEEDELIQIWMLHHLRIIGEAARSLSAELIEAHPDISWQDLADFRTLLTDDYFQVDLNIIWAVVEQDLPILKHSIAQLFALA